MNTIIFATNNQNKVSEVKSIVLGKFNIISLKEAGIDIDIAEPFDTLEENAKEKAKSLADAAGIRLGRVVDVQESGGGYPIPFMRTMELKAEDAAAAMPVTELNPGENKVSMTVVLSYETY